MTISVNGAAIPDSAIDREVQYHPAASLSEARDNAAFALVVRRLLLDEVARHGIAEEPEALDEGAQEIAIAALLEREVRVPDADEATCRRYFETNRARFRSPDLFEAAHILFPADPTDEAARAVAKEKAAGTIAELTMAPERFAELARARSACPSAGTGGSLGQITRGQTVTEFETFLYNIEPGTLCPVPVPTRFGYHVLRLDRRIDGAPLEFDAVKARIAGYLREASWRRALRQYIQILAGRAYIDGIDLNGAETPLVQ